MTALPVPKFQIGDVVYFPSIEIKMEPLPCPDCLGTRKWKVVTPAGTELETECQRCMSWGRPAELPKPERLIAYPVVRRLTVGKIEVTTHPWEGSDPIRYMACETGIGSGSIYDERKLYASEDAALAVARARADARTAEIANEPKRLEDAKLSSLTIRDADLERTWGQRWEAWYRYRNLSEAIQTSLEDKSLTHKEMIEAIEADIEWSKRKDEPSEGDVLIRKAVLAALSDRRLLDDVDDDLYASIADAVIDAVIGATGRRAFEDEASAVQQAAE